MLNEKLTLIGAGNMGEALLKGWLDKKLFAPEQITAVETCSTRREAIQHTYRIAAEANVLTAIPKAQIILLAVKPQIMGQVLETIAPVIDNSHLIISIAAGVKIATLQAKLFSHNRIIRVMPNTPALIQSGISAICGAHNLPADDLTTARRIFEAVGQVVEVEEKQMDAVTALSGSGPAYVFLIIEALADAGVSVGLARPLALQLAVQTILGSTKLLIEKNQHPAVLRDMVTSPGGTTIAGLQALEEGGLRAALLAAVQAACKRSRELGQ
ncbi:MAG: pyrroline-5-carboxylate reductase [Candidatus Schekmanbacteria bacterium]|nr:pyrroline-5-carboxylate reductase [Candidatus Schekmanbacteria bacterium]